MLQTWRFCVEHNIRQMGASAMFANVDSFIEVFDHILAHLRTNFFNPFATAGDYSHPTFDARYVRTVTIVIQRSTLATYEQ